MWQNAQLDLFCCFSSTWLKILNIVFWWCLKNSFFWTVFLEIASMSITQFLTNSRFLPFYVKFSKWLIVYLKPKVGSWASDYTKLLTSLLTRFLYLLQPTCSSFSMIYFFVFLPLFSLICSLTKIPLNHGENSPVSTLWLCMKQDFCVCFDDMLS